MERRPAALDAWAAELAPLSDKQRLSVSRVAMLSNETHTDDVGDAPRGNLIDSPHILSKWLSAVRLRDAPQDARLASLQAEIDKLDALISRMDAAQALVGTLNEGLEFVISHSSGIISQAAQLADGQAQLEDLYTQMAESLAYFAAVPRATSVLSAATPDTLDIPAVVDVVQSVSKALAFMQSHPQYLDAHVYQLRLENNLTHVAELVKASFSRAGTTLAAAAANKVSELDASDSAKLETILYGDFELGYFRPIFAQLEDIKENTCQRALGDCRTMWCSLRASLLRTLLAQRFGAMNQMSCTEIATRGTEILDKVCVREAQQYEKLFSLPSEPQDGELRAYLRGLGQELLSVLSQSLRVAPMSQVAEVCTVVNNSTGYAAEWSIYVLRDVCTRLLAGADESLRRHVSEFVPDAAQLADAMRPLEQPQHSRRRSLLGIELSDEHAALFSTPESVTKTWYAPIRHTFELLAMLHTRVPLHPFVEFAAKALDVCVASVERGGAVLRDSGPTGAADADAFALRHLFQLKELYYMVDIASKQQNVAHKLEDIGAQSYLGASYVRVGVVIEALQSVWQQPRPTDAHGHLAPVLNRINTTIETASTQLSAYLGSSIALPLRVFVAQRRRGSSPNADAAWDTFQQSLDVNLAEMQERLAGSVRDARTVDRLQDAILVRSC